MIELISPADLPAWFEKVKTHGQPVVLDVRELHELQTASVQQTQGFELIAIPMGSIVSRLSELDPTRPVACLCHHGARSMQVAGFLEQKGFTHLANITGGIHAWATQVDPSIPRY
jgi:rhodanese-related sulfurtransferase